MAKRRGSGRSPLRKAAVSGPQTLDRAVDIVALALQVADLVHDLLRLQLLLKIRRVVRAAASDQVVDLRQRESELLAAQDHLDPNPVCGAVEPGVAFTPRLDE